MSVPRHPEAGRSSTGDAPRGHDGEDPDVLSCPHGRVPTSDPQLGLHPPDLRAGGVPRHREARRDLGRRPPPSQAGENLQVAAVQCRRRGRTFGAPGRGLLLRGCLLTRRNRGVGRDGGPDRRWSRAARRRQRGRGRGGVDGRVITGHLGPPRRDRAFGSILWRRPATEPGPNRPGYKVGGELRHGFTDPVGLLILSPHRGGGTVVLPRIRTNSLTGYARLARSLGLDPAVLMGRVGLDLADLAVPDRWIPAAPAARLLDLSAQQSDCPDFGLRMAAFRGLGTLGPLSVVLRDQPDLRSAVDLLVKYEREIGRAHV